MPRIRLRQIPNQSANSPSGRYQANKFGAIMGPSGKDLDDHWRARHMLATTDGGVGCIYDPSPTNRSWPVLLEVEHTRFRFEPVTVVAASLLAPEAAVVDLAALVAAATFARESAFIDPAFDGRAIFRHTANGGRNRARQSTPYHCQDGYN